MIDVNTNDEVKVTKSDQCAQCHSL